MKKAKTCEEFVLNELAEARQNADVRGTVLLTLRRTFIFPFDGFGFSVYNRRNRQS